MNMLGINFKSIAGFIFAFSLGVIAACNGSGYADNSSGSGPTMAQFTALQNQVDALQKSDTQLQTDDKTLQARLTADEATLGKIALLGHQPDTNSDFTRRTNAISHEASAIAQAISYGPCNDMGVFMGVSQPDPLTATIEYFKQCTGYEYGAVVETGAIAKPVVLWFDGANCTGNMFEAEDDGGYNRQVLQNGVVFISPLDGTTELMVAAGQTGRSTVLLSNFTGGACNSGAMETQTSYHVTINNLSITGVPSVVPTNFIL